MDRFVLDHDEDIEKQCGEVFFTTKGRISIHCTLCEDAFCGFESYQTHLYDSHSFAHFKIEIDEDTAAENRDTFAKSESDLNTFDANASNDFQIEWNSSKQRFANLNTTDANISNELDVFPAQNDTTQKEKRQKTLTTITELNFPTVVREVVKRKVYVGKKVPEEDKKHKCPVCSLGFKDKYNMRHHLRRHSNERNHACSYCDKRFYSSTELNTHIKSHTHEKPLLCPVCGGKFASQSLLGGHLKRHRGQRDYHCQHPGCQKSFYTATYLKNHMLSHSNERRIRCTICNAGFKQRTAYKNHLKLHENKLEYKCQICEAEFNQKAGLFSHMKTVHKSVNQ